MTDPEFNDIMWRLHCHSRRKVIRALLFGNDTCCFTVDQYIAAWTRIINKGECVIVNRELAEKHLRGEPKLVREVRPGLWAAVTKEEEHG